MHRRSAVEEDVCHARAAAQEVLGAAPPMQGLTDVGLHSKLVAALHQETQDSESMCKLDYVVPHLSQGGRWPPGGIVSASCRLQLPLTPGGEPSCCAERPWPGRQVGTPHHLQPAKPEDAWGKQLLLADMWHNLAALHPPAGSCRELRNQQPQQDCQSRHGSTLLSSQLPGRSSHSAMTCLRTAIPSGEVMQ